MNCLPSHRHLLSLPAMVQFILPLPFEKGPFNLISILFLPNLFVLAFNPLFAKHLKVFFGSILMILLDLLIEISAPKLDYWAFTIHPVPLSNYLWWFVFSFFFHLIYQSNTNKEFIVSMNILIVHFLFFGMLALFL